MSDEADQIQGMTEITLSSGLDDDTQVKPKHINIEYVQEQRFKGVTRRFMVFNDTQLYYTLRSFRNKDNKKQRFNLNYVNTQPDRACFVAWRWLSTAIAALVWSIVLLYVGLFSPYQADYIVIVGVLMGTAGLLSMAVFYYRTQEKLIYKSYIANIPLFEVSNFKAGNKEFEKFIARLTDHIEQGQAAISMQQRLAGELKELRRIRDEGAITNEQYETARGIIFKHEAYRAR